MEKWGTILVAALAAAVIAPCASADNVYRWVDDKGVVNYGSEAPRAGVKPYTVREIDAAPAIVSHDDPGATLAREDWAQRLAQAEEARLRRELLQAQIDTENAKAAALRAQSQAASSATSCGSGYDCYGSPWYVVSGYARRDAKFRPGPLSQRPVHAPASASVVVHPVGTPFH